MNYIKKEIRNFIKYTNSMYCLYYYFFNILINIMKIFITVDNNLIIFNSYGGRRYDCSPKEIFNCMLQDERFNKIKFVWAFYEPDKFDVSNAKVIKTGTLQYFIYTLRARVWVTNSSIELGLNFKQKKTLYFNTWHGTPIKKMGIDIPYDNLSFRTKGKFNVDIITVQSDYDIEIFQKAFQIQDDNFLKIGLPRNDIFTRNNYDYKKILKRKLGIPHEKIIILYAPTFREFKKDKKKGCIFSVPFNLEKWQRELGSKYFILLRVHYEISTMLNIENNDFVKDVTDYIFLNDLMIVSDILISDYSSIYFDYSIMNKPMFHFTYDYDEYSNKRGMYFDIRKFITGSDDENELIYMIKEMNLEIELNKTKFFRKKFINYYGNATKLSVDYIYNFLNS